jgi:hypothetical protein
VIVDRLDHVNMTADLRHRYRAIVGHMLAKTASSVPDKARMNNGVHSVALSYGGNPYRHRDFHHGPWHSLAAALLDMALYAIWSLGPWSMESANKPCERDDLPFREYAAEVRSYPVHTCMSTGTRWSPATGQLPRFKKACSHFPLAHHRGPSSLAGSLLRIHVVSYIAFRRARSRSHE